MANRDSFTQLSLTAKSIEYFQIYLVSISLLGVVYYRNCYSSYQKQKFKIHWFMDLEPNLGTWLRSQLTLLRM